MQGGFPYYSRYLQTIANHSKHCEQMKWYSRFAIKFLFSYITKIINNDIKWIGILLSSQLK